MRREHDASGQIHLRTSNLRTRFRPPNATSAMVRGSRLWIRDPAVLHCGHSTTRELLPRASRHTECVQEPVKDVLPMRSWQESVALGPSNLVQRHVANSALSQ